MSGTAAFIISMAKEYIAFFEYEEKEPILSVEKHKTHPTRLKGTIKVFGTAYAGTQISIGTEKKTLMDDYQFTQFVRTQAGISSTPAQR